MECNIFLSSRLWAAAYNAAMHIKIAYTVEQNKIPVGLRIIILHRRSTLMHTHCKQAAVFVFSLRQRPQTKLDLAVCVGEIYCWSASFELVDGLKA